VTATRDPTTANCMQLSCWNMYVGAPADENGKVRAHAHAFAQRAHPETPSSGGLGEEGKKTNGDSAIALPEPLPGSPEWAGALAAGGGGTPDGSEREGPAAAAAAGALQAVSPLLTRLLSNVVTRPGDSKFRRVWRVALRIAQQHGGPVTVRRQGTGPAAVARSPQTICFCEGSPSACVSMRTGALIPLVGVPANLILNAFEAADFLVSGGMGRRVRACKVVPALLSGEGTLSPPHSEAAIQQRLLLRLLMAAGFRPLADLGPADGSGMGAGAGAAAAAGAAATAPQDDDSLFLVLCGDVPAAVARMERMLEALPRKAA
jgi:hypothetical protein